MNRDGSRHVLDRPIARVVAFGCFALSLAALAYIHRDDLFPAAQRETAGTAADPFARCFADSAGKIDRMLADGTISRAQAGLFRSRAEARCRAQTQKGAGPPPRPLR